MYIKSFSVLVNLLMVSGLFGQSQIVSHGFVTSGGSAKNQTSADYSMGQAITFTHQDELRGNTGILQVINPTSTSAQDEVNFSVSLFPNPTLDFLEIRHNLQMDFELTITNSIGQIIHRYELSPYQTYIDVSTFLSGTYYIAINVKSSTSKVYKFIKF